MADAAVGNKTAPTPPAPVIVAASSAPAKAVHIPLWKLVLHEIRTDDVLLRSSSLAYSTLASLVPVFAIILAVLSGDAFKDSREHVLDALASTMVPDAESAWIIDAPESPQQEIFKQQFREYIVPLAERAGAVSIFGFLVLLITVGMLFRTVEKAFNIIWRAASHRTVFMRLAVGTSMIFWGPVMLALSVALGERAQALPVVGTYVMPLIMTTLAFTMFYMVMPNAKVKLSCALCAGAVAALCWEGVKLLFLVYVTQVVSYNRVYGSLGLIPMLFLWVYVNWIVVLSGAELAYSLQFRGPLTEHLRNLERQKTRGKLEDGSPASPAITMAVAIEIARRFQSPCPGGVKVSQIAEALQVERAVARVSAERLVSGGVLVKLAREGDGSSDDDAYMPAGDPKTCDISALLLTIFQDNGPLEGTGNVDRARNLLRGIARETRSVTLADLARTEA